MTSIERNKFGLSAGDHDVRPECGGGTRTISEMGDPDQAAINDADGSNSPRLPIINPKGHVNLVFIDHGVCDDGARKLQSPVGPTVGCCNDLTHGIAHNESLTIGCGVRGGSI